MSSRANALAALCVLLTMEGAASASSFLVCQSALRFPGCQQTSGSSWLASRRLTFTASCQECNNSGGPNFSCKSGELVKSTRLTLETSGGQVVSGAASAIGKCGIVALYRHSGILQSGTSYRLSVTVPNFGKKQLLSFRAGSSVVGADGGGPSTLDARIIPAGDGGALTGDGGGDGAAAAGGGGGGSSGVGGGGFAGGPPSGPPPGDDDGCSLGPSGDSAPASTLILLLCLLSLVRRFR